MTRLKSNPIFLLLSLIAVLNYGCASRAVTFTSEPAGALVRVGSDQCITPCTMDIDCDHQQAIFVDSSQQTLEMPLPECDKMENFEYKAFEKTEYTLKAVALPFGVIGFLGLAGVSEDVDKEESVNRPVLVITAGAFAIAGVLYLSGEGFRLLKERCGSEVHANFPSKYTPEAESDFFQPDNPLPDPFDVRAEDHERIRKAP